MGFAQDLFNFDVKEIVGIDWSQHHYGIGASASASDGNNILISAYQPTISRHHGYLTNYLHPLTKDTQDIGDYIPDDMSIEFVTHGSAHSRKGMGSGKDYAAVALENFSVLFGKLLGIWFTEAGAVADRDYP